MAQYRGKDYTPSSGTEYPEYPVKIAASGDSATEDFFNEKYIDIYDRMDYLNSTLEDKNTDLEAIKENIDNNVGGEVTGVEPPEYTGTQIVQNGDTHHAAIVKLDFSTVANTSNISSNEVSIQANAQYITNVADKIDPTAIDASPFNYANTNLIIQGERVKSVVEKYDRYILGTRRSAEFSYKKAFEAWYQTFVNAGHTNMYLATYDTFYDTTKLDMTLTTATISADYQKMAIGTGDIVSWRQNSLPGEQMGSILFDYEHNSGGSIEVRFHLNGETNWENMEIYTVSKKSFQVAANGGENLVVKVKLASTPTTELYNFQFIVKA